MSALNITVDRDPADPNVAIIRVRLDGIIGPSGTGKNVVVAKLGAPERVPGSAVSISGLIAYRAPETASEAAACDAQRNSDKAKQLAAAADARKAARKAAK